jgi:hypothetical protein
MSKSQQSKQEKALKRSMVLRLKPRNTQLKLIILKLLEAQLKVKLKMVKFPRVIQRINGDV